MDIVHVNYPCLISADPVSGETGGYTAATCFLL